MTTNVPVFYLKVLNLNDTVVAAPLEVAGLEFSETAFVPGQISLGSFRATLRDIRDPLYDRLRDDYHSLNYEMRCEIYADRECKGSVIWSGVLTELPSSLDRLEVVGEGILHRLNTRKLRRYQTISGNVATSMQTLLKTYDITFKDDFSGTLSNWTGPAGWTISNGILQQATADGTSQRIHTNTTWGIATWKNSRVSFDFRFSSDATTKQDILYLSWADELRGFHISSSQYGMGVSVVTTDGATPDIARDYPFILDSWNHLDAYFTSVDASNYKVNLTINGVEVLEINYTTSASDTSSWFLGSVIQAGGNPMYFDNFIFAPATSQLTVGTFDSTSSTVTETFNNDTNLTALNWLTEYMDWEYRVNPAAGKGNDTLDMGASLGTDFSTFLTLEEGKNIVELSRDRMSNDLATSLYVYGQAQDDVTSNFISNDLSAMDTYGIIEKDYSDPRVVDVAIAKTLGDNRLSIVSAGNVSISGKVLDESALFGQLPVIGYATIGDAVIGGRNHFRAGDYVWLKSPTLNINKRARIVQITRRSGDPSIQLTFDYFPRRNTGQLQWVHGMYEMQRRSFIQRMNTQNVRLALSGTTAQSWYVYLRGQIASVYLDIRSASWAGAVTVGIDGVDRTSALFGAATITADAHANDTTYLTLSGNHFITLTPTQTVTIDMSISAKVLS